MYNYFRLEGEGIKQEKMKKIFKIMVAKMVMVLMITMMTTTTMMMNVVMCWF